MSGWLITKPYEANAGGVTLEALFAVWQADQETALRMAEDYGPLGSRIRGRILSELSESVLRGLKLRPGQAGLLRADRPWI